MSKAKKPTIKAVAIFLKPHHIEDFSSVLPNLVTWLVRRKKSVFFPQKEEARVQKVLKAQSKQVLFINEKDLPKKADLYITLGGDGTLLGVSRKSGSKTPPIFGVNMGRLGFITEFSKIELFEELEKVLKGKYELTRLNLFKVQVFHRGQKVHEGHFLNDVVINKNDISRMFTLTVESEDDHIFNISGDGLIISSPVGSTAYSLAAGGPIIHPEVNAMVLTPICPHSLTHRPIVVPDDFPISIRIAGKEETVTLTLDGQEAYSICRNDIVKITRPKTRAVSLIKNPNKTYFHTLKDKFTHGRREGQ